MKTASAVDIMREFDSVCLESDSENVNNMAAATSDTCANVKTPSKKVRQSLARRLLLRKTRALNPKFQ